MNDDRNKINIYECFDPIFEPPNSFIEECERYWVNVKRILNRVAKHKIGNTTYFISTKFSGKENLVDKVKSMIFDNSEADS